MGLNIFVFVLLIISSLYYFVPVSISKNQLTNADTPLLIFDEPLMYSLNEKNIHRIIQSTKSIRYKNRDEMFDADIILRNEDPKKTFNFEKLKSDKIIKINDDFDLIGNVRYKRDEFVNFNTQRLFYNQKTKIAKNKHPYNGNYYKNLVKGVNLYLDANKHFVKAQNVHFNIDMKNKGQK